MRNTTVLDKSNSDILNKVKKLLALGSSPSEAEAASALEKARLLLARHGLSLEDLESHSPVVTEGLLLEKKRLRAWESQLIHVIALCTFTQALHVKDLQGGRILLVGRDINIRAAQDLFEYLHKVVLIAGRANSPQVAHLDSFRMGLVHRVGERLQDESRGAEESGGPWQGRRKTPEDHASRPEERQLTLQMAQTAERENQKFIGEKYGRTAKKKVGRRVEAESYYRGRAAGDGVSIQRQIK